MQKRDGATGKGAYQEHPWAYAAISAVATNVASLPFSIYRDLAAEEPREAPRAGVVEKYIQAPLRERLRHPRARKDLEPVTASGWSDLFERPNPFMVQSQLWESTMVWLMTEGRSYWVLEGRGERLAPDEIPSEIWPVPVDWMAPRIAEAGDKSGRPPGAFLGWELKKGGGSARPMALEPHQVVWFHRFSPTHYLDGQAPLRAVEQEIRQDEMAASFNGAFFENGGEPGGVLVFPGELHDDQRRAIRESWEDRHQGPGKANRLAILTEGMEYRQLTPSHTDMQFLEQRRWSRDAILAALRVPESELQLYENMTYANALASDRSFWTKSLIPWVRMLEATLFAQLFTGQEFGLFDLSAVEALQSIMIEKLQVAEALQRLGYPINMINRRLDLGMEDVEWGDVGYVSATAVPADQAGSRLGLFGGQPGPDVTATDEPAPLPETEPKAVRQPTGRMGGALWERIVERNFTPGEARFQRKVRAFLYELRKAQLQALDEAAEAGRIRAAQVHLRRFAYVEIRLVKEEAKVEVSRAALDAILFAEEQWANRLRELLHPEYRRLAALTFDQVASEIGGIFSLDLASPEMLHFLAQKESKIVRVTETIRAAVRDSLIEGMATGENIQDLQARVKTAFNFLAAPSRTLRIARTESAQTVSGVRNEIYQAEGVERHEWLTAGDEHVRDDHRILGRTPAVEIGHNYMADLGKPGVLRYPSDINGPPAETINCRCVAVAVR